MSLVEISEAPPVVEEKDGKVTLDSRVWFQVLESLRRLEQFSRALEADVKGESPFRVYPVVAYGRGAPQTFAVIAALGTNDGSAAWSLGEFPGYANADVASYPSTYVAAELVAQPGEQRRDLISLIQAATSAVVTSTGYMRFVWTITIPLGFKDWKTDAIVCYFGFGATGVDSTAYAQFDITATSPVSGIPDASRVTGNYAESSNSITVSYGEKIALSRKDLAALDLPPGSSVQIFLRARMFNTTNHTGAKFQLGRVEINWE